MARVRLRDLISVKHGFAFDGRYFRTTPPGDILLTPGNFKIGGGFTDSSLPYSAGPVPAGYVLGAGDLLVTMTELSRRSDTLGFPAIIPSLPRRALHNQRIGRIQILKPTQIDSRYLYYLLCTRAYRAEI